MSGIIYLNGEFVTEDKAKISVFDRSYLFGEGLFESFRSYDGHIPFLKNHLARLEWSATYFDWEMPADVDFGSVCSELLQCNGLKDARFRLVLSRAHSPTGKINRHNLVIFCQALDAVPHNYRLQTMRRRLNDGLPQVAMKTTNYLTKILARHEARAAGFDDAILLNHHGRVTEAASGNLFWLDRDGHLFTPMAEEGMLGGIMRQQVMQIIKNKKMTVREGMISAEDFSHAREIFLTNSVVGIKPVVAVDQRVISGGDVGGVTQQLMEFLDQHIKQLCKGDEA